MIYNEQDKVIPIEKDDFEEFLHFADTVNLTFEPMNGEYCPLAKYLSCKNYPLNIVNYDGVESNAKDLLYRSQMLPNWAKDFVCEIDRSSSGTISAKSALNILKSIEYINE